MYTELSAPTSRMPERVDEMRAMMMGYLAEVDVTIPDPSTGAGSGGGPGMGMGAPGGR